MMDYKGFLKKLPMFSSISAYVLDKIQQYVVEKSFKDKEVIFEEGSEGENVYIVYSGSVEIYKNYNKPNQKLLSILFEGEIFGETSLFNKVQRTATAVAKGETSILEINSHIFLNIFNETPNEGIKIVQYMLFNTLSRLERTSKELATIYRISQLIMESLIHQDGIDKFLINVSSEIEDVLPEFCSFGIYLYNKFNEEYELILYKGQEKPNWLKDTFNMNDGTIKILLNSQGTIFENNKIFVYYLKEDIENIGFIFCITNLQFKLPQQINDLLLSIANLLSISIKSLKFIQEEKERLKLQISKSKYIF